MDFNTEHIYGHRMSVVMQGAKMPNLDDHEAKDNVSFNIKNEGIYCFGGVYGKNTLRD